MDKKRFALVIVSTAAWLIGSVSGCQPLPPAAVITPTSTVPSSFVQPDGALPAEDNGITSPGQAPANSSAPDSPPGSTQNTTSSLTPPYDISIGFNMGTRSCNYDTAGNFSRLAWVSMFENVRFTAPPPAWTGETLFESELIGEDSSLSELADYAFCWTWESDAVYDCFVTEGPNPFLANLDVFLPSPETEEWQQRWMTVAPLATDPIDRAADLYLIYEISYPDEASPEEQIIIRAGDGHLGDCDMLGGPNVWLPHLIFPIPWQRLMKGEEFIQDFVGSPEDYEVWGDVPGLKWTVHFVPSESK